MNLKKEKVYGFWVNVFFRVEIKNNIFIYKSVFFFFIFFVGILLVSVFNMVFYSVIFMIKVLWKSGDVFYNCWMGLLVLLMIMVLKLKRKFVKVMVNDYKKILFCILNGVYFMNS